MPNPIDLTGQRSGKLVAVHSVEGDRNQKRAWLCNCDCGGTVTVKTQLFREGKVQSCGCLNRQPITGSVSRTHGYASRGKVTPTYQAWQNMIQRCTNPNRPDYHHYGGRGITICERWMTFENFLADVGEKPKGLSIDRFPDNNGNYEPGNVRWANQTQQVRNSRAFENGVYVGNLNRDRPQ